MTATQDILMTRRMKENSIAFKLFIFILNLSFFMAVPVAMAVTGTDGAMLFKGLIEILCGPSCSRFRHFFHISLLLSRF